MARQIEKTRTTQISQERKKMLDGRESLCNLASEKHERSENNGHLSQISSSGRRESKIFVYGLAWTTTTETLAEVFGKFDSEFSGDAVCCEKWYDCFNKF
eukprot:6481_1